jgi:phosphoserine phosphatase RsbU/P
MRHRLQCAQVWGGIRDEDVHVSSSSVDASLFSMACEGGRGGDIYYFSVCGSDQLTRVAVADVVGHGSRVADVSGWLYEALRQRMNSLDGSAVLDELNQQAIGRGLNAMTTAAVTAVYRGDGHLYAAYAGHYPMLVCRAAAGRWTVGTKPVEAGTEGFPLGVASDARYPQHRVRITPCDRLALYTDGLLEAFSPAREQFGLERLLATLDETTGLQLDLAKHHVIDTLRAFTDGNLSHDDITLLLIEVR